MANKWYVKGANFERMFCDLMEKERECIAIRSAGSHSPVDVILIPIGEFSNDNIVVAQLKTYVKKKPKVPKDLKELKLGENITKWFVSKCNRKPIEIEVV